MDFFIAPHIFGDDFGDPLDESGDEKEDEFDSPEAAWVADMLPRMCCGGAVTIHGTPSGNSMI